MERGSTVWRVAGLGDTAFHRVFMGVIETASVFFKDCYGDVTPMMKTSVRIISGLL